MSSEMDDWRPRTSKWNMGYPAACWTDGLMKTAGSSCGVSDQAEQSALEEAKFQQWTDNIVI